MSIALRFIPILDRGASDKIMKAQMARGADFESGNLIQRAKAMVPLLVPLFPVSAFRRATDLAMAMEARCYRGGEGRTKMKPLRYEKRDRITSGLCRRFPAGPWRPKPQRNGRWDRYSIISRDHFMKRIKMTVAYDGTGYCGWQPAAQRRYRSRKS